MLTWSWLRSVGTVFTTGRGATSGGGAPGIEGMGSGGPAGIWGTGAWNLGVAVGFTAMAGIALAATVLVSSRRVKFESPWSRPKRKHPLSQYQWNSLFNPDGKLQDRVKFLKKVRNGGVDPGIRPAVWPFLLGVYDLNSSEDERKKTMAQKRDEYEALRIRCCQLLKPTPKDNNQVEDLDAEGTEGDGTESIMSMDDLDITQSSTTGEHSDDLHTQIPDNSIDSSSCALVEDKSSTTKVKPSITDIETFEREHLDDPKESSLDTAINCSSCTVEGNVAKACIDPSEVDKELSEGSHSDCLEKPLLDVPNDSSSCNVEEENSGIAVEETESKQFSVRGEIEPKPSNNINQEHIASWQRIIRLDAIRTNEEWIPYSPSQAAVSEDKARQFAEEVGLKDYNDLEPCRIFHAARLVAVLDAYALHDPETGYCQGMSDLLSPILAVMEEDHEAFWCFVGFMAKARHNFRLDEAGIRRQLVLISKIIKSKDPRLYRHLEKLEAEGCFFVYRMVLVLFRRELTFEQTLYLWEVMWADQAAFRTGIGSKSVWGRFRMRVPPTEDLLLYAVAAAVLQKHKVIIEKYTTMYEIMREMHDMAGQIDVWKLLDDAHDLVGKFHKRIS